MPNYRRYSPLLHNLRIPASTRKAVPANGLVALGRLVAFSGSYCSRVATRDMPASIRLRHKTALQVTHMEIRQPKKSHVVLTTAGGKGFSFTGTGTPLTLHPSARIPVGIPDRLSTSVYETVLPCQASHRLKTVGLPTFTPKPSLSLATFSFFRPSSRNSSYRKAAWSVESTSR